MVQTKFEPRCFQKAHRRNRKLVRDNLGVEAMMVGSIHPVQQSESDTDIQDPVDGGGGHCDNQPPASPEQCGHPSSPSCSDFVRYVFDNSKHHHDVERVMVVENFWKCAMPKCVRAGGPR